MIIISSRVKFKLLLFILLTVSFTISISCKQTDKWDNTEIDPLLVRYLSLIVDKNDQSHITYCDFYCNLYYGLISKGKLLRKQTIEKKINAHYSNVILDSQDNPHIVYAKAHGKSKNKRQIIWFEGSIEHKWYENGIWLSEKVDNKGSITPTSTVIDKNNSIHIVYYDYSLNRFKIASKVQNQWQIQIIPSISGYSIISHQSINIDKYGDIHLVYYDRDSKDIIHTACKSKKWFSEVVCRNVELHCEISFVISENNSLYVAFIDSITEKLKIIVINGSIINSVEIADKVLDVSCLVTDVYGDLHLAFCSYSLYTVTNPVISLTYCKLRPDNQNDFKIQYSDIIVSNSMYLSLSLGMSRNTQPTPHLVYHDFDKRSLIYASPKDK